MRDDPKINAALAAVSRQCNGDRPKMYVLLLEVLVEFAAQSSDPDDVLVLAIKALQAALDAGRDAAARFRPS